MRWSDVIQVKVVAAWHSLHHARHKSADVHPRHKSPGCCAVSAKFPALRDRHPVLHRIAHNRPEYSARTAPRVSGKCHDQCLPDDLDQLTLTSAVPLPDKVSSVKSRYHPDVASSVPGYAVGQGIANWLSRNNRQHWRPSLRVVMASRHIFHNVHPSCGAWSSVQAGILWQ